MRNLTRSACMLGPIPNALPARSLVPAPLAAAGFVTGATRPPTTPRTPPPPGATDAGFRPFPSATKESTP